MHVCSETSVPLAAQHGVLGAENTKQAAANGTPSLSKYETIAMLIVSQADGFMQSTLSLFITFPWLIL
mgnify:CR=1 FL=1